MDTRTEHEGGDGLGKERERENLLKMGRKFYSQLVKRSF